MKQEPTSDTGRGQPGAPPPGPTARPWVAEWEVINTWPHDPGAFTQGLVFLNGQLLESTGMVGESTLRRVEIASGRVLQQAEVPAPFFAEGLAVLGHEIFQVTWLNRKGFVYDLQSFAVQREFAYEGEGWGLATDGRQLILSNGSNCIKFLDPATFELKRSIRVLHHGRPVNRLNALQYVKGEIFANIWGCELVARINPANGELNGVLDFGQLLKLEDWTPQMDVFNGIAHDPATDHLFVTGKRWPWLFEVRLKPGGG